MNREQHQTAHTLQWTQSGEQRTAQLPLEAFAHPNGENIRSLLFLTHGFGDNAQNFGMLAPELNLPGALCVSLNGPKSHPQMAAMGGRMWFDLFSEPWTDLNLGCEKVKECAERLQQATGVPSHRVAYLGFSQGGCVSLLAGLGSSTPPAGVVSLSGFLMGAHTLSAETPSQRGVPLFLGHGTQDEVVLPLWHFETHERLKELGFEKIKAETYPVAHSLHTRELADVRQFLLEVL